MGKKILILAEHHQGELRKSAFELVAAARSLNPESVTVLLSGKNSDSLAGKFNGSGATRVLTADHPSLDGYSLTALSGLVEKLIAEKGYDLILSAASVHGRELIPFLAGKLSCAVVADCTAIEANADGLSVIHPVYAGKAFVRVDLPAGLCCVSIRPNAFSPEEPGGDPAVENVDLSAWAADLSLSRSELAEKQGSRPELTEASVIVSGGRGMGGPEHYSVIEELADRLGAAVGASRAAVDAGWRPHSDQVGQTGKTVSPNLYIACGISGAIQHLAGMSSSKVIVAVNKDPDAPIFKVATYGIVGDLFQVVPAMTAELKK